MLSFFIGGGEESRTPVQIVYPYNFLRVQFTIFIPNTYVSKRTYALVSSKIPPISRRREIASFPTNLTPYI